MKYSSEIIERVRTAIDIVDYIAPFVALKKRGKNFIGLCPFHHEKTPSFSVSQDEQLFYCFGCGKGGGLFQFVQEYEKLSFVETIQHLARRAGITLPTTSEGEAADNEYEEMLEIIRRVAKYFHEQLIKSNEGKFALEYLRNRGLQEETIRKFGLGYAPKGWDALVKKLQEENISLPLAEKVGVLRRNEERIYDYFRGRVIFPIFSSMGKVIAFSARKIYEDDTLGKYINSPDTPLYNKSRVLFGLSFAKESIREKDFVLLVEGNADFLTVFQTGIENVVASSGTALTAEHIELIARYTKNITIVFDADAAGSNASLRGIDLILQKNLNVRIVQLPAGEDPDSFIRKFGGELFSRRISEAISFVDFIAQTLQQQGKFSSPEGQAEAIRMIVQTIAKIPDELKRAMFIKNVAEKYGIYESTLARELAKSFQKEGERKNTFANTPQQLQQEITQKEMKNTSSRQLNPAERDILRVMLEGSTELAHYVIEHLPVEEMCSLAQTMFQLLYEQFHNEGEIHVLNLFENLPEGEIKNQFGILIFKKQTYSKHWELGGKEILDAGLDQIAYAAIVFFHKQKLQKKIETYQRMLKMSNSEDTLEILHQIQNIKTELQTLNSSTSAKY